uniref:Uncharacterized protein n=1 Tax=Plectus sambesii TaxID=2011161 RepID=A0A914WNF4_9BILA
MSASENVDASEGEEAQIELIDFEEKLIVETLTDDVLFVVARGLGLERLIIHHLKLFSDPQLLLLVINTSTQDEIFYIEQLKRAKVKCQPKLITADISTKDRQALYLEGGVQFVTSRILVVDLLTDRIPVNQVAGIIVCRAHQLLSSYQESFILRLYREKKPNGFVKAFTDFATAITSSGLGQLQRLVARLYVRKVELVPRFEASVKECLNQRAPELIEMTVEMSAGMRKIQSSLVDIIRTCLKELKQCTSSVDVETEDDATSSAAALYESKLERDLEPVMATLTDKQQRLLEDLKQLRHLLKEAEQLDPVTLYHSFTSLQSSKEVFASNSGWLFTPTASKIYEEIEKQCKPPSGPKSKQSKQGWNIQEPPKWSALKAVLNEIREAAAEMKANSSEAVEGADASETAVLLIGAGEPVCRQLCDLIKLGPERLKWMLRRHAFEAIPTAGKEQEPECDPWWDPNSVTLYGNNGEQNAETRAEMLANVKMAQRNALRQGRKRRQQAAKKAPTTKRKTVASAPDPKQTKLLRFGIGAQRQNEQQQQVGGCSFLLLFDSCRRRHLQN